MLSPIAPQVWPQEQVSTVLVLRQVRHAMRTQPQVRRARPATPAPAEIRCGPARTGAAHRPAESLVSPMALQRQAPRTAPEVLAVPLASACAG
mgnify:CR=1 FL=1